MDWNFGHASLVIGAGVIALLIAGIYWITSERKFKRAAITLVIAGATCVVSGPIGQTIGGWTLTLDGWISSVLGQFTGALVLGGIVGILIITPLAIWIKNNKINTPQLLLGLISPFAVAAIPGYIGYGLTTAMGWIAWLITWPIALGLGWA